MAAMNITRWRLFSASRVGCLPGAARRDRVESSRVEANRGVARRGEAGGETTEWVAESHRLRTDRLSSLGVRLLWAGDR